MKKIIVQTRTFFKEEVKDEFLKLNAESFKIFKKQKGLISIQMHINHKKNETLALFEWESKEDHEACMQSPDFGEWGKAWQKLVDDGKIKWELETYEVLHAFQASFPPN